LIRVKEESPLEEELSINFVIVIHAFRFLIKGSFLMFKLSALLSVLLLSACARKLETIKEDGIYALKRFVIKLQLTTGAYNQGESMNRS
jgi:hypothetical protein